MKFTKMEGIGNDFIVIRADDFTKSRRFIKRLCDRHFGIGADGFIIIMPSEIADFKFRIFNSDGSEAEMCGNGIRCACKYAYDNGIILNNDIKVETLAGIKYLSLNYEKVNVDMGKPLFKPDEIPVSFYDNLVIHDGIEFVKIDGPNGNMMTCLAMGNPHAVLFVSDIDSFDVNKYGKIIENDNRFLNRTNVEFVEVVSKNIIKMRVWERGVGETLASGTGACAGVIASVLNGMTFRNVCVLLPGGRLDVVWAENDHVYLIGEAKEVFKGEFDLEKYL